MGFLLPLFFLLVPGSVFAQSDVPTFEIIPTLTQEETRTFLASSPLKGSQTLPIDVPAERLIIQYSADAPFELWVSFPTEEPFRSTTVGVNPLHVLKAKLTAQTSARISIDLTRSPAWYAGRRSFILHVLGEEGKTVEVQELTVLQPTFSTVFGAYLKQFFTDEPVLLSSINFLAGYRVADMSVTFFAGSLFLFAACVILFAAKKRKVPLLLTLSLALLLLYDGRVSLDLLRVTRADLAEWNEHDLYRQLGPIYQIADFLKEEREQSSPNMRVAMCFDGTDFLQKQLRYLLYPTPVLRPEDIWASATHAVFIDTDRGMIENGMASCPSDPPDGRAGSDTFTRPGKLLRAFPEKSRVVLFTDKIP